MADSRAIMIVWTSVGGATAKHTNMHKSMITGGATALCTRMTVGTSSGGGTAYMDCMWMHGSLPGVEFMLQLLCARVQGRTPPPPKKNAEQWCITNKLWHAHNIEHLHMIAG